MHESQYVPKNIDEEIRLRQQQNEYQGTAHRDVATAKLASIVAIVFGVLILVHYVALIAFAVQKGANPTETLESAFHEWLPVLSGFLGAAISYYFADKKR